MKTLILLRHAKSGWDDPGLRDFDRRLNAKGQRAAALVGRNLRTMNLKFDRVLASPAVRVVETIDQVEQGYGGDLAPEYDRRLYLAAPTTLLDIVHAVPDAIGSALIVGHNPGLEDLVLMLVASDGARRADVATKFPTASVAVLTFDIDHWAAVAAGAATLTHFVRPRDLDPALGPDED